MCGYLYLLQRHLPVMIILIVYLGWHFFFFFLSHSNRGNNEAKNHNHHRMIANPLNDSSPKKTKRFNRTRMYRKNLSHGIPRRNIHIVLSQDDNNKHQWFNFNCVQRFLLENKRANHFLLELKYQFSWKKNIKKKNKNEDKITETIYKV